ncbi:hypothetical protein AB0C18_31605 [Nonomuraea muscovyensis]|uniref:hypothetical protein n=1 Tax=Nonomuraea muscovyensis TaxID=1124761 RepID=UPI0033DA9E7B
MARSALAALVPLLVITAACASGPTSGPTGGPTGGTDGGTAPAAGEATPGPDRIVARDGDPAILVHNMTYGADMEVGGRLAYRADGRCLVVTATRDGRPAALTPVWPPGTEPLTDGGRRGVRGPSFGPLLDGDTVTAAGDEWPAGDSRVRGLPACGDGFVVFNPGSFRR